MEIVPQLNISLDRLEKPDIEPATPGVQGEGLIHYTKATLRMQSDLGPYCLLMIQHITNPMTSSANDIEMVKSTSAAIMRGLVMRGSRKFCQGVQL